MDRRDISRQAVSRTAPSNAKPTVNTGLREVPCPLGDANAIFKSDNSCSKRCFKSGSPATSAKRTLIATVATDYS